MDPDLDPDADTWGTVGACPITETSTDLPKRVELHIHLDGAVRPETLFEIAKERNIPLPDIIKSAKDLRRWFKEFCGGRCLTNFLHAFTVVIVPVLKGSKEAIRRMAYEYCEDCQKQNICYAEVRYNPHELANCYDNIDEGLPPGSVTPEDVVKEVCSGLKLGQQHFKVKVRSLLCAMRHRPDWSWEVLELACKYKHDGVVGIDIAGDENMTETEPTHDEHKKVFTEAKKRNIHRTVHAGENGTADNVREAVYELHAERVGHGYHVLDDANLYAELNKQGIHYEACPYSSAATGSVQEDWSEHPVKTFCSDGANYSISTDDPTLTQKSLFDEYALCMKHMEMTHLNLVTAIFNAAESSFLPEDEKKELIEELKSAYGHLNGLKIK